MFLDEKNLLIEAGKGGDGVALFRREIYVPRGGPDGGDGGRGGDVILEGRQNLHALSHLAHVDRIRAEDGQLGGHKKSTGKSGDPQRILVPLGTVVEEKAGEDWRLLGDLTEEGSQLVVAKGGNGGWGNWHFRSSVTQTPDRFNPGLPGEKKEIRLTLKLIADVGLLGLPNAGKSTFLASVTAARPKIADYPFTTLEPQLGVATVDKKEGVTLVIADLPGLIEGASQGKGLGIDFLRHLERTKLLVHFLPADASPEENLASYKVIRKELSEWSQPLAAKEERIVISKADLLLPEEQEERKAYLEKEIGKPVAVISPASGQGVRELLTNSL